MRRSIVIAALICICTLYGFRPTDGAAKDIEHYLTVYVEILGEQRHFTAGPYADDTSARAGAVVIGRNGSFGIVRWPGNELEEHYFPPNAVRYIDLGAIPEN